MLACALALAVPGCAAPEDAADNNESSAAEIKDIERKPESLELECTMEAGKVNKADPASPQETEVAQANEAAATLINGSNVTAWVLFEGRRLRVVEKLNVDSDGKRYSVQMKPFARKYLGSDSFMLAAGADNAARLHLKPVISVHQVVSGVFDGRLNAITSDGKFVATATTCIHRPTATSAAFDYYDEQVKSHKASGGGPVP